ncbi:MAG: hypothetical protein AB4041_18770 [Microcystaceae cyanobacterium]
MVLIKNEMLALLLLIGTVLSTVASFILGNPWLTLILGAGVIYPVFLQQVNHKTYRQALLWVLLWAFFQSIAVIVASLKAPEQAAIVIFNGKSYTEEMFHWIQTGEGAEGALRLFLPIHLQYYGTFSLLSFFTLGGASLLLGTYLLNYMNYYVAQLIFLSAKPWLAALIGWPIWSILRVIGFICTGIALTALGLTILHKLHQQQEKWEFPRHFLIIGIGFVIADIIVKALIAPLWQKMLFHALIG